MAYDIQTHINFKKQRTESNYKRKLWMPGTKLFFDVRENGELIVRQFIPVRYEYTSA